MKILTYFFVFAALIKAEDFLAFNKNDLTDTETELPPTTNSSVVSGFEEFQDVIYVDSLSSLLKSTIERNVNANQIVNDFLVIQDGKVFV